MGFKGKHDLGITVLAPTTGRMTLGNYYKHPKPHSHP